MVWGRDIFHMASQVPVLFVTLALLDCFGITMDTAKHRLFFSTLLIILVWREKSYLFHIS